MAPDDKSTISLVVAGLSLSVAGLSLVWNIYNSVIARRGTLSICHGESDNIVNTVMRLQEYVTAFLMHLVISNTSLTRTVTITDYWLEIPWKDDFLRPLPDPEELDNTKVYRFPMSALEYTRDMVINHRRLREGTLAPGATFSGMFLVQGTAEVPFDLYRDKFIPVTIVALDATGKMHRSKHTAVWPLPSYTDVTPPLPPTPLIRRAD